MGITRRMVTVLILLAATAVLAVSCGNEDNGPVITSMEVEHQGKPPEPIKHRDPETVRGIVDNCRVTKVYAIYSDPPYPKPPGTTEGPYFCYEYESSPVLDYPTTVPFGSKRCEKRVESVDPESADSFRTIGDLWIVLSLSKQCKRIHFIYTLN